MMFRLSGNVSDPPDPIILDFGTTNLFQKKHEIPKTLLETYIMLGNLRI